MKRVTTINLNGNAYQLEEDGYEALRAYLDTAVRRLESNPDREEIIADIEQAMADRFRAVLGPNKTVVVTKEVEAALEEMGPVRNAAEAAPESTGGGAERVPNDAGGGPGEANRKADGVKRLYAIPEGAMLAGVCNGFAAYLNIDVTLVRMGFVVLSFFWGSGILVYLIMAFLIPTATTSAEKAAAYGTVNTAQEFIRRARAGYYEGMRTLNDKQAHRAWKKKFKAQAANWRRTFHQQMNGCGNFRNQPWAGQPGVQPGHAIGYLLAGVLHFAILFVALYAIYSLVTSHMVFGLSLPAGMPLWVGLLILVIAWHVVTSPIRHLQCRGCERPWRGPLGGLGDFLAGVAMLALTLWLLDRYVPGFHEWLKEVPPMLHRAVDSVQLWLDRR